MSPSAPQDTVTLPGLGDDPHVSYNPSLVPGRASVAALSTGPPAARLLVPASRPTQSTIAPPSFRASVRSINVTGQGSQGVPVPGVAPREDEFELRHEIARGGFGEVWQAEQSALRREVAIKLLRRDRLNESDRDPTGIHPVESAFYQEAVITANLNHPNIVPIHDIGVDASGRMLLAMKLVRGKLWSNMLREEFGKVPRREYLARHLAIFTEVAQALAYAHARGVIHRDLKPAQVMVGEFGEVQLMDWGLAVIYDAALASRWIPDVMASGMVPTIADAANPAGTPAYMAPEQASGPGTRLCPQTDVFLLGSILYFVLAGGPPFSATTSAAAMARAQRCEFEPIRQKAGAEFVPPELEALAKWCMSADPAQRPANVRLVLERVQAYVDNASRRFEAIELIREVRERLARGGTPDRRELERLDALMARAEALFPEHNEVVSLRTAILAAYASVTTNGDRDVAGAILRASQLSDRALRTYLVQHIERAWASRRRAVWLPLELFVSAVVVGLVLVLLVLVRALV